MRLIVDNDFRITPAALANAKAKFWKCEGGDYQRWLAFKDACFAGDDRDPETRSSSHWSELAVVWKAYKKLFQNDRKF